MRFAPVTLLPLALLSLPAAADSCYVTAASAGSVPPPVITEQCFEFVGMKEKQALDWACRDVDNVRIARRNEHERCPAGYFATCTAGVTPETLTSARATGSQGTTDLFDGQVPEHAKIVSYYYEASDRSQAKVDCESAGGEWGR
ncbi:hypothetical protein JQR85_02190 [Stutzerimonas urumqiensis]|uniref:hypothetical protein n=1 Tax=Stutzerimonas urumqiensis TaxID=638269 RepID=UPI003DA42007